MIRRFAPPLGLAWLAALALLVACGGGEDTTSSPTEIPPQVGRTEPPPAEPGPLDDSSVGLIFLGPAGDWLYPRDIEVGPEEIDELLAEYVGGLRALRAGFESSAVVAAGRITPPTPMRYETGFSGFPQVFIREADVDVLVPSAFDLIQGPDHIRGMATGLGCPVVASDLQSPLINESFDEMVSARILSNVTLYARTQYPQIQVIDRHTEMRSNPRLNLPGSRQPRILLEHSMATAQFEQGWAFDEGVLTLTIPALGSNQAAVTTISGLDEGNPSVRSSVVDLLPGDAPAINYPDLQSMTLGMEITQQVFQRRIRDMVEFESVSESILNSRDVPGWPSEADEGRSHLYEFQTNGRVTHRLFAVKVEPGEGFLRSVFLVVCDPQWENPEIVWLYEPIIVQTGLQITDIVSNLVSQHGLQDLPENPPQMLGAEIHWRAIRRGLSASAVVLDALRRDLPQ